MSVVSRILAGICVLATLSPNQAVAGFGGIGASVGETNNDLRIPWRQGSWLFEPQIGGNLLYTGTEPGDRNLRYAVGLYRSSKFGTPSPARAMNDFAYLGPVYKAARTIGGEATSQYGLVVGGEHFMSVSSRTNEYNRFSLAAECQLMVTTVEGVVDLEVNAGLVGRYYFGLLDFSVTASDRLELEED